MRRIFIAGTGTDIGKTYVTALLARQLYESGQLVEVIKPVITGWKDNDVNDTQVLLKAVGLEADAVNIDNCSPWRFMAPLAADMAAEKENRTIEFDEVVEFCKLEFEGIKLIEGAGGLMSPVSEGKTFLDLIEEIKGEVILICGSYLGSISHTLTAIAALGGIKTKIVLNETAGSEVDLQDTANSLAKLTALPITILSRGEEADLLSLID